MMGIRKQFPPLGNLVGASDKATGIVAADVERPGMDGVDKPPSIHSWRAGFRSWDHSLLPDLIFTSAVPGAPLRDDVQALEQLPHRIREVPAGEDVARLGEAPEHLHIVIEGWAARYESLRDGARQITAFLLPRDFCDLHAAYFSRADHSVCTLTPVRLMEVPREALLALAARRPGISRALWLRALADERVLRAWLVNISQRDAYSRIAHLICELHFRCGGPPGSASAQFNLPLTQPEIGDALGLTAVHVSRTLKRLKEEGMVEIQQHTIFIQDVQALWTAADFDPRYLLPGACLF